VGDGFEVSRKKERKIDGCRRERARYSEPTTTTVRNLKRKKKAKRDRARCKLLQIAAQPSTNEMNQLPRTKMHRWMECCRPVKLVRSRLHQRLQPFLIKDEWTISVEWNFWRVQCLSSGFLSSEISVEWNSGKQFLPSACGRSYESPELNEKSIFPLSSNLICQTESPIRKKGMFFEALKRENSKVRIMNIVQLY